MLVNRLSFGIALPLMLGVPAAASPRMNEKPLTREAPSRTGADGDASAASAIAGTAAAAQADVCTPFGNVDASGLGPFVNIFRGNLYRIQTNAILTEFKMDLAFTGSPALHFSIHRRLSADDTGDYQRVIPDVVVSAVGDNTQTVYSTGPLASPVTLEAGYDYVLGVAWTDTLVKYFRTAQIPNTPFLNGVVLGSAAVNAPAPLPDSMSVFLLATAVHTMELCFEPQPGACCDASATACADGVLLSACSDAGDFFVGELTSCGSGLCAFGACCLSCGASQGGCQASPSQCEPTCEDQYTPEACAAAGGTWAGAGVTCPATDTDLCPIVIGACCHPEPGGFFKALCTETCIDDCEDNLAGTYLGDATTCEPNRCVGACCASTFGCGDVTRDFCGLLPGAFRGEGTTCDALPADQECGGACCLDFLSSPVCVSVSTRAECSGKPTVTNTVYMGDATSCSDVDCTAPGVSGACCLPDGSCVVAEENYCNSVAGSESFSSSAACTDVACTTCCLADDSCRRTAEALDNTDVCTATLGGTVDPTATSCVPNPCGVSTGACCFGDGTTPCTDGGTQAACDAANGRFVGGSVDCNTDCSALALGSCCRPNGTCDDHVTAAECATFGGTFNAAEACSAVSCRAACCARDGTCTMQLEADCTGAGIVFLGAGTSCTFGTCPTGACCLGNGCAELTESWCTDASVGGTFQGDGSVCTPNPCDQACCAPDGTCSTTNETTCTAGGGTFLPATVTCDVDTCPTGACCTATGCRELTEEGCLAPAVSGTFQGDGTVCAPNPCPQACCASDGTCTLTDETACTTSGGTFLTDTVVCDGSTCPTGACCTDTGCQELTEEGCLAPAVSGTFLGDGTACTPNPCPQACCASDGTCTLTDETACTTSGGTFLTDTVVCDGSTCPTGACCTNTGCQELTEEGCLAPAVSGTFQGDGTVCTPNPCLQACCATDGTCSVVDEDTCTTAGSTFFGTIEDCSTDPCAIGACCEPDGTCTIDLSGTCVDPGETFFGAGTSCTPDPCPAGACCTDTGCQELTPDGCAAAGGTFEGAGTDCTSSTCGACCAADGTCTPQLQADCADPGETFGGIGAACDPATCPTGACCTATGCQELTSNGCVALTGDIGNYQGDGTVCTPNPCDQACCAADGACSEADQTTCEAVSGSLYLQDTVTCAAGTCPTGACCTDTGCQELTEEGCTAAAGSFQGDATACTPNPCNQACCAADGSCSENDQTACEAAGGTFLQSTVMCAGDTCPTGACCTDMGCQDLTSDGCTAAAGAFEGAGTNCLTGSCGACCAADGSCMTQLAADCTDPSEAFLGAGTSCGAGTCPTGACCTGTGCQEPLTHNGCVALAGSYQGDATACTPDPCVIIASSLPPNCAIDAREPSDPDGTNPVDTFTITFDGPPGAVGPGDFILEFFGASLPDPLPVISDVSNPSGDTWQVQLDQPIPAAAWTCLTYDPNGSKMCFGTLPADVDSSGTAEPADVTTVINCLGGALVCELWQCDTDRSGAFGPADILRTVDLINGADQFTPWSGVSIGSSCPNP